MLDVARGTVVGTVSEPESLREGVVDSVDTPGVCPPRRGAYERKFWKSLLKACSVCEEGGKTKKNRRYLQYSLTGS